MSEFLFVLKCLVFTAVLVIMMQLKVGGVTIEDYSYHWLRKSTVSQYIQSAAAGGAMALRNLSHSVKEGVAGTAASFQQGASEQAYR
jgi:hypothetical protein